MKPQANEPSVQLKTKRISTVLHGQILAGLIVCLALSAQAAVQVTRFDPPLQISAYAEPPENAFFNVLGADLDAEGEVDFRLAWAYGAMSAYFNAPARFNAGVPLDSVLGTNIVSPVPTNSYAWSPGYTNRHDLTQSLGDHEATMIIANLVTYNLPGPIISIFTNGMMVTNIIYPHPIVSGPAAGKDAVVALEFYVNGQLHYGYIHCNFTNGASGVIYGWSYETEANVAIEAKSLAPDNHSGQPASEARSGIIGFVHGGNLLGWTLTVSSPQGTAVTNVLTDDVGLFKADLPAGSYVLTPFHGPPMVPGLPVSNSSQVGRSRRVNVLRNHFRFIEMIP
jgi:hypothetical protein